MKKTPRQIINEREIALPRTGYSRLLRFILKIMQLGSDVSYKYDFNKKEIKNKQVILLADHATREAYKYVIYGYPFAKPNIVIGYHNIFVKRLFGILLKAEVIPKKLYQTDLRAVSDMLKVLKLGGSLCLFPEGIQSTSGSTHPIYAGTASFLKRAEVPVVLCKSYGSYLVKPRYKRVENKGHQEFHYEVLFTEDDLRVMSVNEIYDRLLERFKYNDFEWNKENRYKYRGTKGQSLADGIDSILYRCPNCGGEFTLMTVGEHIICKCCGNDVMLNEYYDLIPASEKDKMPYSSIDEWYKNQRKTVREEVKRPFRYEYECDVYDIHTEKLSFDPFYACGEGVITITNESINYKGTRHGEEIDLTFEIKHTPSFNLTTTHDNDLYYHDEYYCFKPKNDELKAVKYMLLVEEAHRLLDKSWDKISEDVYEK